MLALAGIAGGAPSRDAIEFGPVRQRDGACRLGIPGSAPSCPCEALDARTRLALGLPVALDALEDADLELLEGIGPVRAAAIAAAREEEGAFGSRAGLVARVRGIGESTAARIAAQLGGRRDASCESTPPAQRGNLGPDGHPGR